MKRRITFLAGVLAMATGTARALETERIELREGTENDGAVVLTREEGALILRDTTHGPVSLGDLLALTQEHGALDGLEADDHPQYLNEARHEAAHDATFNAALAIPTDAGGNTTLGGHTGDADIHLRRDAAEAVSGAWVFTTPIHVGGGIVLFPAGTPATSAVAFDANAALTWYPSLEALHFGRTLEAATVRATALDAQDALVRGALTGNPGGVRTATLEGFAAIEGVAWDALLARTADESVTGAWSFLAPVRAALTEASTAADATGLEVEMTAASAPTTPIESMRRSALGARLAIELGAEDELTAFEGAGVRGEALVGTETTADVTGVAAGVVGRAVTAQATVAAVGSAGVATAGASGARRIGVLGALDDAALASAEMLPAGAHAGVFLGDVRVVGNLLLEQERWQDRAALASVGFRDAWTATTDALETTSAEARAWFAVDATPGSEVTAVRVKWFGAGAEDVLRVRLLERDETGTTGTFGVVGSEQVLDPEGVVQVDTYVLPAALTVSEGRSVVLELVGQSESSVVRVYAWGVRASRRAP
ncbi:MAG: hypothetical protein KF858_13220 [Candidatus Sumerlaeia bacterium]|nr:hypothetical protein [Candidatus Sumerlaeia bacterium]